MPPIQTEELKNEAYTSPNPNIIQAEREREREKATDAYKIKKKDLIPRIERRTRQLIKKMDWSLKVMKRQRIAHPDSLSITKTAPQRNQQPNIKTC